MRYKIRELTGKLSLEIGIPKNSLLKAIKKAVKAGKLEEIDMEKLLRKLTDS